MDGYFPQFSRPCEAVAAESPDTKELYDRFNMLQESLDLVLKMEFEVGAEIERVEKEMEHPTRNSNRKTSRNLNALTFGRPFFKDRAHFQPPPNEDVKTKKKFDEINLTDVPLTRRWQRADKKRLLSAIHDDLVQRRVEECKAMLFVKPLEEYSTMEREALVAELAKREEIIKTMTIRDLVCDPNREYDWMKISATDLSGTHSPEECRALWCLYYNPAINKHPFSAAENARLKELVYEYNNQNWDMIASKLNTGRSGYQCLIQHQLKLNKTIKKSSWSKEEDYILTKAVNELKVGNYIPWGQVTKRMEGRTKVQVFNHYKYTLAPNLKKGRFSAEESQMILAAVRKYGQDFKQLARFLPGRTPVQIRDHYKSHLMRLKTRKVWDNNDDSTLMHLVEEFGPKNWSLISKRFPEFTRGQLRHRYMTILKWKDKYGDIPVPVRSHKTRNKAQLEVHDLIKKGNVNPAAEPDRRVAVQENDLVGIQEKLGLQKEIKVERRGRKAGSKRQLLPIDKKILEYFETAYRPQFCKPKKPPVQEVPKINYDEEAEKVKAVLSFFKLPLKLPVDDKLIREKLTAEDDDDDFEILKAIRNGPKNKKTPSKNLVQNVESEPVTTLHSTSEDLDKFEMRTPVIRTYNRKPSSGGTFGACTPRRVTENYQDFNPVLDISQNLDSVTKGPVIRTYKNNKRCLSTSQNGESLPQTYITASENTFSAPSRALITYERKRKPSTSLPGRPSKYTFTFAEQIKSNLWQNSSDSGIVESRIKEPQIGAPTFGSTLDKSLVGRTIIQFPSRSQSEEQSERDRPHELINGTANIEQHVNNMAVTLTKQTPSNLNKANHPGISLGKNLDYTQFFMPPSTTTLIGCRTMLLSIRAVAKQFYHELRKSSQCVTRLKLADVNGFSTMEEPNLDGSHKLLVAATEVWWSRLSSLFFLPMVTTNLPFNTGDGLFDNSCTGGSVASRSEIVIKTHDEFGHLLPELVELKVPEFEFVEENVVDDVQPICDDIMEYKMMESVPHNLSSVNVCSEPNEAQPAQGKRKRGRPKKTEAA